MKFFTTVYSPLYKQPTRGEYYLYMPAGSIVDLLEIGEYSKVLFATNSGNYTGYIYSEFIEEFFIPEAESNVLKISTATPSESDAAQYMVYLGNVQYNLCGEFSVMYCLKWRNVDVKDWLDLWKSKSLGAYNYVFGAGGRSRTTGISHLLDMFKAVEGYDGAVIPIQDVLTSERLGRILSTPKRWENALSKYTVIIGCKIDRTYGRLTNSGIPHWVVVEFVFPRARGGEIVIYNPFSNSMEHYQWEQFQQSIGVPYGLAVPR